MNRLELLFRNGCQKWHVHLERCAKTGRFDEATRLLRKVEQYLEDWKTALATARTETREAEKRVIKCRQKEASIHLRMRMLGQLLMTMGRKIVEKPTKHKEPVRDEKENQLGGNNE